MLIKKAHRLNSKISIGFPGEYRYDCFNLTHEDQTMLKDGSGHPVRLDMDDFDPANDLEDYSETDKLRKVR